MTRYEIYPSRYGAQGTYDVRRYSTSIRYTTIASKVTLLEAKRHVRASIRLDKQLAATSVA